MITAIERALPLLRAQVEEKLRWGTSENWTGADFERLSALLFQETEKRLSVTTLKRAWGRTTNTNKPSATTLNILANFVGLDNWRQALPEALPPAKTELGPQATKKRVLIWPWLLSAAGLLLVGYLATSANTADAATPTLQPEKITFSVEKVTQGIPNTVIFRYDLGGQIVDTLELQQTWDATRRIVLDTAAKLVTTTYMSPGYFNAKLVADGQIVQTEDLYLPSDGFNVYVIEKGAEDFRPLEREQWQLAPTSFTFAGSFVAYQQEHTIDHTELVNLLPSPVISADSFTFKTRFLQESPAVSNPCHGLGLVLVGTQDVYYFALGDKGCAGYFSVFLGGQEVSGKHTDLSYLGFSADQMTDLTIKKQGSQLLLTLNDQQYTVSEEVPAIGPLGGVRLFSREPLMLKELAFIHSGEKVDLLHN